MLSLSEDTPWEGPGSHRAAITSQVVSVPVVLGTESPPQPGTASAGLEIQPWRMGAAFTWEKSHHVKAGTSQWCEGGCTDVCEHLSAGPSTQMLATVS